MAFFENSDSAKRKRSAETAIRAILALDLYPAHKRRLLSKAIWFITEADGKYSTRYKSEAALKADKSEWRHEHVFTKKQLIDDLLKPHCKINEIIRRAIGCVVTIDEHERLHAVDKSCIGWKRYAAARIEVIDTKTDKPVKFRC